MQAVAQMESGGAGLPIPTGMVTGLIANVIPSLTDDKIEEYALAVFDQLQWVLDGDGVAIAEITEE